MLQHQRDQLAGLNTAGFITGYRGSPLGGVDQTAVRAKKHLERHNVRFQPGLNEDLAATAVWGTQQVNMYEGAKYDGVFSMWYGKGPGVDRCGDVFKHANAAGTSKHGGVLALAGDDHGAKSSTLPHQSDHIFKACMIPVLYPGVGAGVSRSRPARLRDEPLCGRVGRHENGDRGGRGVSVGDGRSGAARHRASRRFQ